MSNIVIIDSLRIKTVQGEFGKYVLNQNKQIKIPDMINLEDAERFANEIKKAAEMFRESWQGYEEPEDEQEDFPEKEICPR